MSPNWLCIVDQRSVGISTGEAALKLWGGSSLGVKQDHQEDLRLSRITRCKVALAATRSSRAASACRKCLAVVQESMHSVLKQILLMRVALDLPAP